MRIPIAVATFAALAFPLAAQAQVLPKVSGGVELSTDESRRGLSWSENQLSASGDVSAGILGFDASARVAMVRESSRHAGADTVFDLEAGHGFDIGLFKLRGFVTGHVFTGAARAMDYVEVGADGRFSLGPLQLNGGATYAPDQGPIGGDNLYLHAGAAVGVPSTPFTVSGSVGHTTGSTDDIRAARLRPTGDYTDWRIGVEHVSGPLTLGVDYVGTDIDTNRAVSSPYADLRHSGNRVLGRARLSF
ncbi:TorF family putative porin [uncultured Sphingomonas sp.]|uniref:TorF family putative porin n=1 Tax=uncultured Sphingomonas sp. TaxID=158754 RepID=UPI0025FBAA2E|nr:TorF family putative porin [uncultured Sphingomonas sp.]